MDIFNEQLLKRNDRPIEKAMKYAIAAIAILAIILCIVCAVMGFLGIFSGVMIIVALGIGAAAFFYLKSLNIEYEYSLTNGEFDIDKITGRSKRKHMYSFKLNSVEEFGHYKIDKEKFAERKFDFRVSPANLNEDGLYYCVVRDSQHGVGLIVLQPNDKMKDAMRIFIPRQVQGDVLRRD